MADNLIPPSVNALITVQPLNVAAPERDATGVPAQLLQAPPGKLIEGFVVNRDSQSNPILRTVLGDVLVKSEVFIKTGSEVVFRVDPSQPGYARIITVNGQSLADYAAASNA